MIDTVRDAASKTESQRAPELASKIDNRFYDVLGERWYIARDDPVALLRAESRLRNPWVAEQIAAHVGSAPQRILDIGCGAGFLSNALARLGHHVTGIDRSRESLDVARRRDATRRARYLPLDAHQLAFADESFDVVCAMDFLEHTDRPESVVREAARVLRPGGAFFFHTFNRNRLCELIVIRGVEWFVRNTPRHMHVYDLFVKPSELEAYLERSGLELVECLGVRPRVLAPAFWRMVLTGSVPDDFEFRFTGVKWMGYSGWARKRSRAR